MISPLRLRNYIHGCADNTPGIPDMPWFLLDEVMSAVSTSDGLFLIISEIVEDILLLILALNLLFAVVIVFVERKNPTSALAWLLVLLLLPALGFALFLVFGQNYHKQRLFNIKIEDDQVLQQLLLDQKRELSGGGIMLHEGGLDRFHGMIAMLLANNGAYLTTDNHIEIYTNGREKFDALLAAIAAARDHIHMEYYIIRNDDLGREIIAALAKKAREGVTVRFLYDAVGCMRIPPSFFRELNEAGGKVAAFFPSRIPRLNIRINYRNHRKIAIIDGSAGFIGGFNIGDEYLGKDPRLGYWRDTHIRINGSAVAPLQLRFFLDWNFAAGDELGLSERYFPHSSGTGSTAVQIVSSGPDARWNQIKEAYIKLINTAEESVYIQSPYFVPDGSVMDALRIAALSGIDVRIMIPCKPDHPFVYWSSCSYIGELLEAGVRGYTYDAGFIHSKTIVVDGVAASVGSANWDVRSFGLNFEANAFIYDREYAGRLKSIFLADLSQCTEITRAAYEKRRFLIRVKESFSRLLSPVL